jgi:tryptophan halogenase
MNITVLGGGTAGWITALLTHRHYPNANITVIESDEIGILGAGEGTTSHFLQLLKNIDVPVSELIKHCKATIKQGIRFTNWHGDSTSFFHSFIVNGALDQFNNLSATLQLSENKRLHELDFANQLSLSKKVLFTYRNNSNCLFEDSINSFQNLSEYALHFDARLLADFFKKVGVHRGINIVEGKYQQAIQDDHGNIKAIQLENRSLIDTDFVFDCSGFARLLIGKLYQTKWISYEKHLPMKMAVPFFIDHNGDISPETDSIAMKYGWIWKIPVDGRYGCGYVFDSDYITADQALQEAEEYFGHSLTSPKTFKFSPGSFEKTLVNNCMAVGLAQSFVEPLEATSIWISYNNLHNFLRQDGVNFHSNAFEKMFNQLCLNNNNEISEFIYLHYLTKRNDSLFWKEFRNKNQMVESLEDSLEILKYNQSVPLINKFLFSIKSWAQVAGDLQLLDSNVCSHTLKEYNLEELILARQSLIKNQENLFKICVSHKEFLDYIWGYHET